LTAPAEMKADIRREQARMRRRYVAAKRHTMEVDFDDYRYALRRELRAGARRAEQARFRLFVQPRGQAAGVVSSPLA